MTKKIVLVTKTDKPEVFFSEICFFFKWHFCDFLTKQKINQFKMHALRNRFSLENSSLLNLEMPIFFQSIDFPFESDLKINFWTDFVMIDLTNHFKWPLKNN